MSFLRRNKKKVDKGLKKVDAVITGLVLGGIVASVYGIKKYEDRSKKKDETQKGGDAGDSESASSGKMRSSEILKALIFGFKKGKAEQEKKGFFSRLFSLFSRRGKK